MFQINKKLTLFSIMQKCKTKGYKVAAFWRFILLFCDLLTSIAHSRRNSRYGHHQRLFQLWRGEI